MTNETRNGTPFQARKGAMIVLAAILLVFVLLIVAFVVDFGYVTVARTEVQRAADSAAHAAALEYRRSGDTDAAITAARNTASNYSLANTVTAEAPSVDKNENNEDDGDVVVGRFDYDSRTMSYGSSSGYNAVTVRIHRDATRNGNVPLFFAKLTGISGLPVSGEATAALVKDVGGFRVPSSGEPVPFLPITVQIDHWYDMLEEGGDKYAWDSVTQEITDHPDGDGNPEVNIFPESIKGKGNNSGTDGAGNFGTVNVGTDANSTSHLADVIRNGLTQEHLDHHGGALELDHKGELMLNGDPGISAGIKDDLAAIMGKPVIIPLYKNVSGNGNNARFRIVKFVGVRLVEVNLRGNNKAVLAQPAQVTYSGVLEADEESNGSESDSSDLIYSPISIVH